MSATPPVHIDHQDLPNRLCPTSVPAISRLDCELPHTRAFSAVLISDASVVVETTKPKGISMTNLKILAIATLLIASVSTSLAQRATLTDRGVSVAPASQETGPFENMSRVE